MANLEKRNEQLQREKEQLQREKEQLQREKEQLLSHLEVFGNVGKRFEAPVTVRTTCNNRFPLFVILLVNQAVYAWNVMNNLASYNMTPAGLALVNQMIGHGNSTACSLQPDPYTYFPRLPRNNGDFLSCQCQSSLAVDQVMIGPQLLALAVFGWYAFRPCSLGKRSVYTEMTLFSFTRIRNRIWVGALVFVAFTGAAISTYFVTISNLSLLGLIWMVMYNQSYAIIMASVESTPDKSGTNGLKQQLVDEARKLASDPAAVEMQLKS